MCYECYFRAVQPHLPVCLTVNGVISVCSDNLIRCFQNMFWSVCLFSKAEIHSLDLIRGPSSQMSSTFLRPPLPAFIIESKLSCVSIVLHRQTAHPKGFSLPINIGLDLVDKPKGD